MPSGPEADFIVVGAGSAGCVLAARLSEDPAHRVILLEAGKQRRSPIYQVPLLQGFAFSNKASNWGYETEPQTQLAGQRLNWPRGRLVGGCHAMNGMVYVRGNRLDYDQWRQMGNRGWSYRDVLPYFRRAEDHEAGANAYHGTGGPLRVRAARRSNPLFGAFVQAGVEAGFAENPDFNGASQEGFGTFDFTIHRGLRWTTARGYLGPALKRPNLRLETQAQVVRILFEGRRAVGVVFRRGGREETLRARREVILAGGAINTPQMLLLSGIGPAEPLRALGIEVRHALPGVGQNLQDHCDAEIDHLCTQPVSIVDRLQFERTAMDVLKAAFLRRGPFTESPIEGGAFLRVDPASAAPDSQVHFKPFAGKFKDAKLRAPFRAPDPRRGAMPSFSLRIGPIRPESRGEIRLRSADPFEAPVMDPRYLTARRDMVLLREGLKIMRRVMAQPALAPYRGPELRPGAEVQSDDEWEAYIRENLLTVHHMAGTARMGADPMAVVSDELRVHGIEGLRIADASVMPTLTSGNTNAPTIMIAEKAADLILGREPLPASENA